MSIYFRQTWENIPAAVEAPEILRLLALWEREAATGTQPNIDQFDLDQMPEIAPHAVVLMVLPDNDYYYDHYGSAIAKVAKMNMAGHRVSDFNSEVRKFFKEKHDECMASGRPVYTVHRADHAAAVPTWERLILPCIDPRSGIARIFVYMRPHELRHEFLENILAASADGVIVLRSTLPHPKSLDTLLVEAINPAALEDLGLTEKKSLICHF